ncbi:hypothetical protein Goari_024491 [Gossypium aridum]|uniref:Transmembrane protein n=1 Tax=Gossypium aridum TaxID=34290 RepID=A0A7J8X6B8_GOSAI|nr:hypothetical protein [Gossypium aridum]
MFYLVIAREGEDRSIWVFKVLHADSISSMSSMAEPQKKTHKTSRFLACFGFSCKKNLPKKPIQTGSKNTPSLSFPMLCFRPGKSRTKTVPVDNSDKTDIGGENHTPSKLSKKKSDIKLIPSRQNSKPDPQLSFPSQASRTRPKEGPEPNILLGNRKLSDPTRTGSSLPGSPTVKPKINLKTQSKLSHTVSLPVLDGNQRVGNPRKHDRVNSKQHQRKNNGVVGKFDSAMGLSIIMVILVIMLVWGRVCAILCTSAWFYFRSRYRTINNDNDIESTANSNESDLNSKEYKKKIVLEGLLERNHRVGL